MECSECGSKADKNWEFCPNCGANLKENERDMLSEIFERFGQEFAEMNKMLERRMEVVDLSPFFKNQRKSHDHGGGFSISITTSGNSAPKVSVKTFGDVDEKMIKRQVYGDLGEEYPARKIIQEKEQKAKKHEVTEEPKTKVEKHGNGVVVEMELPGVKENSIEINDLESSIEVKALAGKKAFFKIIKKPENHKKTEKEFNKGILRLKFS